jgi:antitoxin (DNA-binding transcriptional repressor) of toxin-antitoxin stability system
MASVHPSVNRRVITQPAEQSRTVSVAEARARFSELLDPAEAGETVLITAEARTAGALAWLVARGTPVPAAEFTVWLTGERSAVA